MLVASVTDRRDAQHASQYGIEMTEGCAPVGPPSPPHPMVPLERGAFGSNSYVDLDLRLSLSPTAIGSRYEGFVKQKRIRQRECKEEVEVEEGGDQGVHGEEPREDAKCCEQIAKGAEQRANVSASRGNCPACDQTHSPGMVYVPSAFAKSPSWYGSHSVLDLSSSRNP